LKLQRRLKEPRQSPGSLSIRSGNRHKPFVRVSQCFDSTLHEFRIRYLEGRRLREDNDVAVIRRSRADVQEVGQALV